MRTRDLIKQLWPTPLCLAASWLAFGCGSEARSFSDPSAEASPQASAASTAPTSPNSTSTTPTSMTGTSTLTYYRDAAPVLNQYCTNCHAADGLAPFALDTYANAAQFSQVVSAAVSNKTMPLLPVDLNYREIDDARVVPSEARQILLDWVAQGSVEGDPKDAKLCCRQPDRRRRSLHQFTTIS